MGPREFLEEECRSVAAALRSTLRHDYGPERSRTYFEECKVRLEVVERALEDDKCMARDEVAENMQRLASLGSRISLIERSHLGEFSWPFARIIEKVADKLFVERTLDDDMNSIDLTPIVHVVAEGTHYQIVDDEVSPPGKRRIIIVAFPRQLKHHVLLHTIFGHELGHTAIHAEKPGRIMNTVVLPRTRCGPLQDQIQARTWLHREDAPANVRDAAKIDLNLTLDDQSLINWRTEITCDLFGLRLFGPAFAAAHRTIIEAHCPGEDCFELESTTHPPYPIRQRIIATAVQILGWDKPVTTPEDGVVHRAEKALIDFITQALGDGWFELFTRSELKNLLDGIEDALAPCDLAYSPPDALLFKELIKRLAQERPPICQEIREDGEPVNYVVDGPHCLYAGWTYWFGKGALAADARVADPDVHELSFLELNRLCDQALLQQEAINLMNHHKQPAPSAEAN